MRQVKRVAGWSQRLWRLWRTSWRKYWSRGSQKTYEDWARKGYESEPEVTFVIQSHNASSSVFRIVEKLRLRPESEIIVIDDGSTLRHSVSLLRRLRRANEFILRAHDLYEVITYDRAIYLARGRFVVLLQDDDDFDDASWVDRGLSHFRQHEDLVILGGRDGAYLLPIESDPNGKTGPYTVQGDVAYRVNSYKYRLLDPKESPDFRFVHFINRAPMFLRRDLFLDKLKHIDQSYAPFQWDDAEICLRAWTVGLKVGWYSARFRTGFLGVGGMRIWNDALHQTLDERNMGKLYSVYGSELGALTSEVESANAALSSPA